MFAFLCRKRLFLLSPATTAVVHNITIVEAKTPCGPNPVISCVILCAYINRIFISAERPRSTSLLLLLLLLPLLLLSNHPVVRSNGFPGHCAPSPDICLVVVSSSVSPSWRDQSTVCVLYGTCIMTGNTSTTMRFDRLSAALTLDVCQSFALVWLSGPSCSRFALALYEAINAARVTPRTRGKFVIFHRRCS